MTYCIPFLSVLLAMCEALCVLHSPVPSQGSQWWWWVSSQQLGHRRVGHAAVHPCLPVLGHVELELYKQ